MTNARNLFEILWRNEVIEIVGPVETKKLLRNSEKCLINAYKTLEEVNA